MALGTDAAIASKHHLAEVGWIGQYLPFVNAKVGAKGAPTFGHLYLALAAKQPSVFPSRML